MDYIRLQEEYWAHKDPLKEAERLIDLHEANLALLGESNPQILNDAKRILKPYSNLVAGDGISQAYVLRARIYFLKGDAPKARNYLNTAMRSDPRSQDALDLLIETSENGNPALSLRFNAFRLLRQYREFNDVEDLDHALILAHLALKHDSNDEIDATYYLIASIHDARTQYRKGLDCLDVALKHNPTHETSLKLKAKFERALGGGDMRIHRSRRGELPYTPSPADSPIAEFMREFHETHNGHIAIPMFRVG